MSKTPSFHTLLIKISRVSVQLKTKEHLFNQTNFHILSIALLLEEMEEFNLMSHNLQLEDKLVILHSHFPFCFNSCSQKEISNHYSFIDNYPLKKGMEEKDDPLGSMYQSILTKSMKQRKGIVFTPVDVIEYILTQMEYPNSEELTSFGKMVDLACGSGLFLTKAVKRIITKSKYLQLKPQEIINYIEKTIHGFDIDPLAVFLTKINIARTILSELKEKYPKNHILDLKIYQTNSLERKSKYDTSEVINLKSSKFDYVVGNPPYVESKRMDANTKLICRTNFPNAVMGSFDLYNCFIDYGSQLLSEKGQLGFIIPNKFLISRYGKNLRERFLKDNIISQIVDLAHQNVFRPAVYPIILILDKKRKYKDKMKMISDVSLDEILHKNLDAKKISVGAYTYERTINKTIFFLDNLSLQIVQKVFDVSRLNMNDLIRFRWSVSFHRKGLRKKFVYQKPQGRYPMKLIGGKEFGGNREVERYGINWRGYWIDYDREKAKGLRNNFQNLNFFTDEKIFLCQHSLRIRATIDRESYISKDIFLLGHLKEKAGKLKVNLELILATLNSKLFSFLYATMYAGTEIMGRYLHYLPMFLHDLPILVPSSEDIIQISEFVNGILSSTNTKKKQKIDDLIDDKIFQIYGCNKEEIEYISKYIEQNLKK
ncbi:MAG: Eco57I restriction-modification methylase domain-containing protein [Candidatus Heimdallarchaeaceae archaeon]